MWIHYSGLEVKEKESELPLGISAHTCRSVGMSFLSSLGRDFKLLLRFFSPVPKASWFSSIYWAGMNRSPLLK